MYYDDDTVDLDGIDVAEYFGIKVTGFFFLSYFLHIVLLSHHIHMLYTLCCNLATNIIHLSCSKY